MIIRGQLRPVPRSRVTGDRAEAPKTKEDKIREIMADKALASYFALACGHYGTKEDDILYQRWRPRKDKHYCTIHGWVGIAPVIYPRMACPGCGHMNVTSRTECENCSIFLF